MKKYIAIFMILFVSSAISAEFTEKQMLEISKKVVDETLFFSKLKGEYKNTLKNYLERVMYNKEINRFFIQLALDNPLMSSSEAEILSFEIMTQLKDKSLLRLSNEDLYELLNLNIIIISKMTDHECSQYIQKKRTDEANLGRGLYEISGQLDLISFKKYIGLYDKALEKLISNKSDAGRLSENELADIKLEMKDLMADLVIRNEVVKNYFMSGKSFSDSPDSVVCTVGKELYSLFVSGDVEKAKKRTLAFVRGKL